MPVIDEVDAECKRQVEVEGWTPEHDDQHRAGELSEAAACYCVPDRVAMPDRELENDGTAAGLHRRMRGRNPKGSVGGQWLRWPWDREWWKPKTNRRNLIRAAALIVKEVERLDRAALQPPGERS